MEDQLWYCLKGYNGYEYSNKGYLRSMKNYKKNPQGALIKKYKSKQGPYFMLVNNKNERVKVFESDIILMIKNNQYDCIRRTNQTNISSRNILEPTKRQKQANVYVTPTFTIIKEKKNVLYFF